MKKSIYFSLFSFFLAIFGGLNCAASSSFCSAENNFNISLQGYDGNAQLSSDFVKFLGLLQSISTDFDNSQITEIPLSNYTQEELTKFIQLFSLRSQTCSAEELYSKIAVLQLTRYELYQLFLLGDYLDCDKLIMQTLAQLYAEHYQQGDFEHENSNLIIAEDTARLLAQALLTNAHHDVSLVPELWQKYLKKQVINRQLLKRINAPCQSLSMYTDDPIAVHPDGITMAAAQFISNNQAINVINTNNRDTLLSLPIENSRVLALTFSPDGTKIAAGLENRSIIIWNLQTGNRLHTFTHTEPVKTIVFTPDGRSIAGCFEREIALWNTENGAFLFSFEHHTDNITSIAFHPKDNKMVSTSSDGFNRMLDLSTGEVIYTISDNSVYFLPVTKNVFFKNKRLNAVSFNPDGSAFTTVSDRGFIQTRNTHTGTILFTHHRYGLDKGKAYFNPNGSIMAFKDKHSAGVNLWINDYRSQLRQVKLSAREKHLLYQTVQSNSAQIVNPENNTYHSLIEKCAFLNNAKLFETETVHLRKKIAKIAFFIAAAAAMVYAYHDPESAWHYGWYLTLPFQLVVLFKGMHYCYA